MKFSDVRLYTSAPRINKYLNATGSKTKAVRLYKANLKIAQAFHPLLGIVEVAIRNRINTLLSAHFSDPDWIINQKSGFMSDASLRYTYKKTGQTKTNNYLKKEIEKAQRRLTKSGATITSGKIIAEQTLGFWTNLFEVHHYKLLSGQPIKIFKGLPTGYGRKEVLGDLNKIRRFRNRINHNEPIVFNGTITDLSETENVYKSLIELISWIDPKLINWINDLDSVTNKINSAKNI